MQAIWLQFSKLRFHESVSSLRAYVFRVRVNTPSFDLRPAKLTDVRFLFETYHGYKSASASATYCFAVYENELPIAAFTWQPPPPGAAKSVCPEAPHGVLALSRMVAVPKQDRILKHISKPLRHQLKHLIDRTRWPVLITYSDEGQGHNGFVYKCSGWTATSRSKAQVNENAEGQRCSSYSNGKHGSRELTHVGFTYIQRWENRVCIPGTTDTYMSSYGWSRVAVEGKKWRSGNQAFTYIRNP